MPELVLSTLKDAVPQNMKKISGSNSKAIDSDTIHDPP
jgi:hypothetical protein